MPIKHESRIGRGYIALAYVLLGFIALYLLFGACKAVAGALELKPREWPSQQSSFMKK